MNDFGKKDLLFKYLSSLGEVSERRNEFLHWDATFFNGEYPYPENNAVTQRFSHFNMRWNCKERENGASN